MTPKQKAIDLIDRMNNQSITIQEWQRASDYAKNDLKRKALIVVGEIIKALRHTIPNLEGGKYKGKGYWASVKKEIEKL